MSDGRRKLLLVAIVALAVGIVFVRQSIDPAFAKMQAAGKSKTQSKEQGELMVQLPAQFLVASVTGFKEVVAGALWIRADSFFHTGQFAAIVPIVRLVTWLDPHNIDVYSTGAWHLDYNFVDPGQMSDKRYIPASVALLKEGIANNPDIWDLYFELGWTHYNKKIQDNVKALEYIELACKHHGFDPNTGKRIPRPEYVDRMLAHQYEKMGMFDDAIKQWHIARKRVEELIANNKIRHTFADQSSLDVCDRNLGLLYLRMGYRYGDMDAYKKGLDIYKQLAQRKDMPGDVRVAAKEAEEDYARRVASNSPPRDALKPLDTAFNPTWERIAPRVIVIKGKVNLVPASEYKDLASESITHWYRDNQKADANRKTLWRDGCRVHWMLADYDYKMPDLRTFSWKIDTSKTVIWDTIYIGGGSFSAKCDFSQWREFYPFNADKYKLTIWISPQQSDCPDFIQDRVGWKGEAFADKNYLDTKTLPGFRILKKEYILDRKDIM